jgi:hypothetical protein
VSRPNSPGTFNAIIDPLTFNPKRPLKEGVDQVIAVGKRYLIIDRIGYDYGGTLYNPATYYTYDQIVMHQDHYYRSRSETPIVGVPVTDTANWQLIDGPDAWKSTTGVDFIADENDIVEYDGTKWTVVFSAKDHQEDTNPTYQTNIYTGVQYKWDGIAWTKSFEGEYKEGSWRLRL